MKRITIALDDEVVDFIQKWRGKMLMNTGKDKSFSSCVNDICKEIIRRNISMESKG